MSAIIVDDVSKKFRLQTDRASSVKELVTRRDRNAGTDQFWALRNVSLEVPEGSMYALIGHNGCGKSTLLRCIAGIYRPTEGRVTTSGRISTLLELGAGFHPDLTGRENVYMNATILGMSRKQIDKVFDEIVDFAGVGQFIDSPVKIYSSGMYVRLGFSVAVHVDPEILIIDEVIAVGDEEFQRRCFDYLYDLRQRGVTVVVVTHGMDTVQTMCDRATWLDHGVTQMQGPAAKVAQAYVQAVNAAEAEASSPATGAVDEEPSSTHLLTHRGTHRGAGEVYFTGVHIDSDGSESTPVVVSGGQLVIRMNFDSSEPVDRPVIGYALNHESGALVTGSNTRLTDNMIAKVDGPGTVEFRTDRLPLLPGTYLLTVAIEDEHHQHVFDRYDLGWRLRVRSEGEVVQHGLVDLGGMWDVSSACQR